jgi:peptidoglycan/LPS O-acetylase OafA/YrhL
MMLAGGVVMAAHLPHHPPLAAPTGLLAGGGCLTIAAMALLARIRPFGWNVFWLVARWALLAYLVIAALLAYVFIYDKTSGATLVVLVATLVVFAVDVPSLMAFTVARYQATEPQPDANG